MRRISVVVLLGLALAAASCNGEGGPAASTPSPPPPQGTTPSPPPSGNALLNPGLEDGTDPWFSLHETDPTVSFTRTEEVARSGLASAHLLMRDSPEATGAKVYYLVQEIAPTELPEVLRGYYRVENWKKGTPKQYLQFVVIVFAPNNMAGNYPNYQIRYILAGIDSPPFPIGNAFFVFVTREEPATGEWVQFERDVREDFQRLWGAVPRGFNKIRILFEVRWDDKEPGQPAEADVYYDDLYFGPAAGGG